MSKNGPVYSLERAPTLQTRKGFERSARCSRPDGKKNTEVIPIWAVSHNAAQAIANAAKALDVDLVIIGASRRSAFYHMLRGRVVRGLMKRLPRDCHLMIYN
jgi:hypothetical protein